MLRHGSFLSNGVNDQLVVRSKMAMIDKKSIICYSIHMYYVIRMTCSIMT